MLSLDQLERFKSNGHVTVDDIFGQDEIASALDDIGKWSEEFLATLEPEQRRWYLEWKGTVAGKLRKLDNPAYHRDLFQRMAKNPRVVEIVEQIIGSGVSVFFSQVFMKPPEVGGPKPVHQDNFYFGPDDLDKTLTIWIALDEATVENGCLYYGDGSHKRGVLEHFAPEDEPFNLQVSDEIMQRFKMTPAPVPSGGISIHHGNTLHQSSNNSSQKPRRAVAFHYLRNDCELINPGLPYDIDIVVKVS